LTQERLLAPSANGKRTAKPTTYLLVAMIALVIVGIARQFTKPKAIVDKVLIVGAQQDILPGTRLGFTSVHYLEIPKVYATDDMLIRSNQVAGRVAKRFIHAGEPITESVLFAGKDGLSANFDLGERALTLRLDDDALVDHAIHPGDKVDVLVTSVKDGKKFTRTVAQSVPVLMSMPKEALASNAMRNNEQNRITFAVTPEQSEVLTEANEVGKLHLILRNRLSVVCQNLEGVSESDLLPGKAFAIENQRLPVPAPVALAAVAAPSEISPPGPPQDAASLPTPLQWVVDVFSGSHRDSVSVPSK
jgi:Flp pilus assembly protein CpaB